MTEPTDRQRQILDFIRSYTAINGYSPTPYEIADSFGFSGTNAVRKHVAALEKKGLVCNTGFVRGIRVIA